MQAALSVGDGSQYAVLLTPQQRSWLLHDTEGWAERAHEDGNRRLLALLDDLWQRLDDAQKVALPATAS